MIAGSFGEDTQCQPIKRLFLPDLLTPLYERGSRSTFELLRFLKGQGHEVFVIALMHENGRARQILKSGIDSLWSEIIARRGNFANFIMEWVNFFFEILPLNQNDILTGHPHVLGRYLDL